MLVGLSTQQKIIIPSFQSIEFKLSENYTTPRNFNIDTLQNQFQPGSLTYTQTDVDFKNSLKFIQISDEDKQNQFQNIQVSLQQKNDQLFESIKKSNPRDKPKVVQMRRKKSILLINNLQLNLQQSVLKTDSDTKRSENVVNFKGIQRKKSLVRHKANSSHTNSVSSQVCASPIINSKKDEFSTFQTENTQNSSLIKKKSISCLKTQDRSIISAVTRSTSKQRLERCYSLRNSVQKAQKLGFNNAKSDRHIKSAHIVQDKQSSRNNKYKKIEQRIRSYKKKQFLDDPVPLNGIINVKSIKLEQNSQVSRTYLRKIIQNRVSIQHYNQNQRERHSTLRR